jgi:hypothetical protein
MFPYCSTIYEQDPKGKNVMCGKNATSDYNLCNENPTTSSDALKMPLYNYSIVKELSVSSDVE